MSGEAKPQVIIFDCWNTLFYAQAHPQTAQRLSQALLHRKPTYGLVKRFERSVMLASESNPDAAARKLLKDLGLPRLPFLVRRVERVLSSPRDHHQPYHDTMDVLKELKHRGYKLGMITNTYQLSFAPLRQQYKLDNYFDVITTSYDVGFIKPDPRIFELTVKLLGVPADRAVMVGDNLRDDVEAAEAAGLQALWIDRNQRRPAEPRRIEELSELLGLLY